MKKSENPLFIKHIQSGQNCHKQPCQRSGKWPKADNKLRSIYSWKLLELLVKAAAICDLLPGDIPIFALFLCSFGDQSRAGQKITSFATRRRKFALGQGKKLMTLANNIKNKWEKPASLKLWSCLGQAVNRQKLYGEILEKRAPVTD